MKNLIIILALSVTLAVSAQAKQDRVMLQQIALLKTYGGYLQKGYKIAKDGLNFIGRMKSGEFNLHSLFFEGLQLVSPRLRDYQKVHDIIEMSSNIFTVKQNLDYHLNGDLFHGSEKDYIRRALVRVAEDTTEDIKILYDVLTDDTIAADDAQRIARIDALAKEMQGRYLFVKRFNDEALLLIAARQREASEASQSRRLYNLNAIP